MSLFGKRNSEYKDIGSQYPWSQRKMNARKAKTLPLHGHSCVAVGNKLIVLGGTNKKKNMKKALFSVDTDDLSINHIKATGDGPGLRSYASVVAIGSEIVVFGGELAENEKHEDSLYVLSTSNNQWTRYRDLANAPTGRSSQSAVAANDQAVYMWGGQKGDQYLDDFYQLRMNTSPPTWERMTAENKGPAARSGHVSIIEDNLLYIFGGADNKQLYNDLWTFDLENRTWTKLAAKGRVPTPREYCSVSFVNGIMYIFGGRGSEEKKLDDLRAYKLSNQRWYEFQNMGKSPSARFGHTLTAVRNKIYVLCGDPVDDLLTVNILDCAKIKYPRESTQHSASPSPRPTNKHDSNSSSVRDPQLQQALGESRLSPPPDKDLYSSTNHSKQGSISLLLSNDDSRRSRGAESDTSIPHSPISQSTPHSPIAKPSSSTPPRLSLEDHISRGQVTANVSHPSSSQPGPSAHQSLEGKPPRVVAVANMNSPSSTQSSPQPGSQPEASQGRRSPAATRGQMSAEDHATMMHHIKARDTVIIEMKKKEQWWRTEVSLARRLRMAKGHSLGDGPEVDEARLISFQDGDAQKLAIFESLVEAKSEIRQIKSNMIKLEEPMRRLQSAALAEAAYYKAKCDAMESRSLDELKRLNGERAHDIQQRLTEALRENDNNSQTLQQLQRRAQDDQNLRVTAEQRAQEAEKQVKLTQDAHRSVLGELETALERLAEADAREREYAAKLADLSLQLSESLKRSTTNDEATKVRIELSRLEIKHFDSLNEVDMTKRQLEESKVDVARLRTLLNERDDALHKSNQRLEEIEMQLNLMKKSHGLYTEEATALTF